MAARPGGRGATVAMKRVVDYPRLYDSAKLAALPSDDLRAEYVWLLGMAGPNGSFEWSERRLWAAAYAPVRDKTAADLGRYLQAFLDAGLLVKWDQDGKTWGYFTGSEKPGRLPRDSWKKKYSQSRQLEPIPQQSLLDAANVTKARHTRDQGTPEGCVNHAGDVVVLENVLGIENVSEETTLAHSKNERGVVDSSNGSLIDTSKSKKVTTANRSILVADLYNRYPRKVGKADAYKAISKAIVTV